MAQRDLKKFEKRAMDKTTPTYRGKHTVLTRSYETDGKHYVVPTLKMKKTKRGTRLMQIKNPMKEALKTGNYRVAGSQKDADAISRQLSRDIGVSRNMKSKRGGGLTKTVPPKRGPNPQGLKNGGCPFRENGSKSPIKGISNIQLKGQKFIGTR
tara:strand:+ start:300 stop:761 length:462 start_codon:yes stop_codon:yes gene_type:complete